MEKQHSDAFTCNEEKNDQQVQNWPVKGENLQLWHRFDALFQEVHHWIQVGHRALKQCFAFPEKGQGHIRDVILTLMIKRPSIVRKTHGSI